jgi:hypothetical protein
MNYVEAIVTSAGSADLPRMQAWFENQGFQTVRMKMGLLVTGDEDLFRRVFEVTADEIRARRERDVDLPKPPQIADSVCSITIRRLPSIQS